jgi:hypothetical protein
MKRSERGKTHPMKAALADAIMTLSFGLIEQAIAHMGVRNE